MKINIEKPVAPVTITAELSARELMVVGLLSFYCQTGLPSERVYRQLPSELRDLIRADNKVMVTEDRGGVTIHLDRVDAALANANIA